MISPNIRTAAFKHIRAKGDGHQIMAALLDAINNRERADNIQRALAVQPEYPWQVEVTAEGVRRVRVKEHPILSGIGDL
ncbi:MAG TPA: hypothetical protein VNU46_05995 [Gemmatimonadaceae bacterium]|jgi:hypothetical protein|nr:hypothetical protein [Gemmatimonadaceae bacterium]